jgi:hypothetical protein
MPPPDPQLSIRILTPAGTPIGGAQPGVTFELNGSYLASQMKNYRIKVTGGGFDGDVSRAGNAWTAKLRAYRAGPLLVTATISGLGNDGDDLSATDTVTVNAVLASGMPDLTVMAPSPAQSVNLDEGGTNIVVQATTSLGFGPRSIFVDWDRNSAELLQVSGPLYVLRAVIHLAPIPLGSRPLTFRCRDAAGLETARTVSVLGKDVAPPHLTITSPTRFQSFVTDKDDDTAAITIAGTAFDTQSGMATGRVEWALDLAGPYKPAVTSNGWNSWRTAPDDPLKVPVGTFTIYVRALDTAGNALPALSVPVQVISSYLPGTLDERLDARSYLAALLSFARDEVLLAAGGSHLASTDLVNLCGQPLVRLSQPMTDVGDAASRTVNPLRVAVEVSRSYLATNPLFAAGRWGFEPTGGAPTEVPDVTGGGSNGFLVAGPPIVDGIAGRAMSTDGVDQSLEVAHHPNLDVGRDGTDFSVTIFLQPTAGVSAPHQWRTIAHKGAANLERTFALWIVPETMQIHARISTDVDANEGIDTSQASLRQGQWTHVAYIKSGSELRLYLDGRLDSRVTLRGKVKPNTGPLRFGNDPWNAGLAALFDDVRVYRFALSDSAIQQLAAYRGAGPVATLNQAGQVGEVTYRQQAYDALLAAVGTSYAELRLARGAAATTREDLAGRLGIRLDPSRPDALDQLTLDGTALTEPTLEALFGLPDTSTTLSPLRPAADAQLLTWRLAAASLRWAEEDHAESASRRSFPVLLDPDVIGGADAAHGLIGDGVRTLLTSRSESLAEYVDQLEGLRAAAADQAAGLAAMLSAASPGLDLQALDEQEKAGRDIGLELAERGLTRAAFRALSRLQRLAAKGTVTETEWSDAVAILSRVEKLRRYPLWRVEESAISLSPDLFVLHPTAPAASPWRADPQARADWQSLLRTRITERRALGDGQAQAVASAEQETLPVLRDALIAYLTDNEVADDVREWLTERLQLNVEAGGVVRSTRIDQAIVTLQSILFSVRSGRLPQWHPAQTWVPASDRAFDAAWRWMGDHESWRAAMTTFLYPENDLEPQLLPRPTPTELQTGTPGAEFFSKISGAFRTLVADVRGVGQFTPKDADTAVAAYLKAVRVQEPQKTKLSENFAYLADTGQEQHQLALAAISAENMRGTASTSPPYFRADKAWLFETFFAVPMLIAGRLHAAGQYLAALDWYQTVFAYNLPQHQRKIYYGLVAEHNTPADLTFTDAWTSWLNPHLVAWSRPNPYTRYALLSLCRCCLEYADAEFARQGEPSTNRARLLYVTVEALLADPDLQPVTPASPGEIALANPEVEAMRAHAHAQQNKLNQGRNIAGLRRQATSTVTSSQIPQPTPYRFPALLARATELVTQAVQVEANYLSALEKYDEHDFRRWDVDQGISVADDRVSLQQLRTSEAVGGVDAAQAQADKAARLVERYDDLLAQPKNQFESQLLDQYQQMRTVKEMLATNTAALGIAQAAAGVAVPWQIAGAAIVAGFHISGAVFTTAASTLEARMQANQLMAGIEQRSREWETQKAAVYEDTIVAKAQIASAEDHLAIATKEQEIAETEAAIARARAAFLNAQFTNTELYEWLSGVLGRVYRFFLQQATATARLAQEQLAFERAEASRTIIQPDYWQPPDEGASSRRGLTGGERLAADVAQLDEYARSTDVRRQNVSYTFSLAQLMPAEFAEFRHTGVLSFATPMAWFDQVLPGQYLRLIRQVRTSVIALVPPSIGIVAELRSSGISRVTTAARGVFRDIVVRRDPQHVAFTSPIRATGVFEQDLQAEMTLPFEGTGVDTQWELALPLPANAWDLDSLADVLFTLDYTALADDGYRAQVMDRLDSARTRDVEVVFSLVRDFPDQWYSLNNPEPGSAHRSTSLHITADSFPNRLNSLTVSAVGVRIFTSDDDQPSRIGLRRGDVGGDAVTARGLASTRSGNAPRWNPLRGSDPVGSWELSFPLAEEDPFQRGKVNDVLLVLGCTGEAPRWTPLADKPLNTSILPLPPNLTPPNLTPPDPASASPPQSCPR